MVQALWHAAFGPAEKRGWGHFAMCVSPLRRGSVISFAPEPRLCTPLLPGLLSLSLSLPFTCPEELKLPPFSPPRSAPISRFVVLFGGTLEAPPPFATRGTLLLHQVFVGARVGRERRRGFASRSLLGISLQLLPLRHVSLTPC